jgi:hypothetical protein
MRFCDAIEERAIVSTKIGREGSIDSQAERAEREPRASDHSSVGGVPAGVETGYRTTVSVTLVEPATAPFTSVDSVTEWSPAHVLLRTRNGNDRLRSNPGRRVRVGVVSMVVRVASQPPARAGPLNVNRREIVSGSAEQERRRAVTVTTPPAATVVGVTPSDAWRHSTW